MYILVGRVYILGQFVFWYTKITTSIRIGSIKNTNIYTGSTSISILAQYLLVYILVVPVYIFVQFSFWYQHIYKRFYFVFHNNFRYKMYYSSTDIEFNYHNYFSQKTSH